MKHSWAFGYHTDANTDRTHSCTAISAAAWVPAEAECITRK
ncbi:hypothetical protein L21SP2_1886 [Salinispira pacifica]|uniref:Uncharacterized protein n=1 Tax=Salinispira pacifica TaxID=1307761 RepID=V5WI76_9SPIO|nr:hypothetical protein L21SP2_1886 [Salinispira pacifica]